MDNIIITRLSTASCCNVQSEQEEAAERRDYVYLTTEKIRNDLPSVVLALSFFLYSPKQVVNQNDPSQPSTEATTTLRSFFFVRHCCRLLDINVNSLHSGWWCWWLLLHFRHKAWTCGQCFESIKRSCSTIEKHHLKVIHGPKNSHSTPVDQKHKTQGPL